MYSNGMMEKLSLSRNKKCKNCKEVPQNGKQSKEIPLDTLLILQRRRIKMKVRWIN